MSSEGTKKLVIQGKIDGRRGRGRSLNRSNKGPNQYADPGRDADGGGKRSLA